METKKIPLTSQVRDLFIVIRKNKQYPKDLIKSWCDEMFDKYAFIEHYDDVEPVTGLVEGCHYHIWAHVKDHGVPKSVHLNKIIKHFKMDDDNGICIEQIANKILAMQYLIHKNNPEKTQHKANEIVTNIEAGELNLMLTSETNATVSFDLIFTLCLSNKNISGVIKALGVSTFRTYRNVVWDIWNDVKSNKNKLSLQKEITKDKAI